MAEPSMLSRALKIGAAMVGAYALLIGAMTSTPLGRIALYANQVNTLFWHDLNYPDQFGFADGQVTPFNLETPDGQTLYAWHVLPLDVYARHEQSLRTGHRHKHPVKDFTKTLPYKLITETNDPPPRVVISFHGNAGHIAQGLRTDTYRMLAIHPNTHVFTIDYRGFGHSTGIPSEAGLIVDGTALVNYVMKVIGIPSERIVILGQSLGTAVSTAVALNFADPASDLTPRLNASGDASPHISLARQVDTPTSFAGVVLVAPFFSIPELLFVYRMGGWLPLFGPFRLMPSLGKMIATHGAPDLWPTAQRLKAYRQVLSDNQALLNSRSDDTAIKEKSLLREMGGIQVLHGLNDRDISYHQTELICKEVIGEEKDGISGSNGPALFELKDAGEPRFRFELYPFGGHNVIVTYSPTSLAIVRAFDGFPAR